MGAPYEMEDRVCARLSKPCPRTFRVMKGNTKDLWCCAQHREDFQGYEMDGKVKGRCQKSKPWASLRREQLEKARSMRRRHAKKKK